jgi:hypothetical protein
LALLGALTGIVYRTGRAPAPTSRSASAEVFSARRAIGTLRTILRPHEPHPVGSAANAGVRERLVTTLIGMGFNVDMQAVFSCSAEYAVCAPVRNVIASLPGKRNGPAVLLAAHYDSVPAGPGVADDGSGVAVLLETARILKREAPFPNPVIFLFTDGEEAGLLGAEAFVKQSVWRRQVGVVLNFEARGTTGPSLMFETSDNNLWLIRAFARAAGKPETGSYMTAAYKRMPNDTDLSVFKRAGFAGMNFAFAGGRPRYHTPRDRFAQLDPASVQHQGDNALAMARALASADLSQPHRQENAVFTDIFSHWLVWWPAAWTLPIAILAAFVGFAAMLWLGHVSRLRLRELGWGLIAWWGMLIVSTALGVGLVYGVRQITGIAAPWLARPAPMTAALWFAALAGSGVIASLAGRRAGIWGLLCGSLCWWWLAAIALGAELPALDAVVLIPAVIGAAAFVLVILTGASRWPLSAALVSMIMALAVGMLWLKIALLMPPMFGLGLSPAVTVPVGLVLTGLAPLFAVAGHRRAVQRWVLGISFIFMLAGAGATLRLPAYSHNRPMALNITYLENAATGDAAWRAGRPGVKLPPKLQTLGLFSNQPQTFVSWQSRGAHLAKAKPWQQPAPALTIIRDERHGRARVLTLRFRSRRHARTGMIFIPIDAGVLSAAVNGHSLAWLASKRALGGNGYRPIVIDGLSRAGVTLTLKLTGTNPVKIIAADRSAALPPAAKPLLDARPPDYVPQGAGDTSILFMTKTL